MHSLHSPRARRTLRAGLLLTTVLFAPAALADEQPAADANKKLDEVVVTAPRMEEPLVIETDPHNPRMPVPPNDGAGYLKSIPGFTVSRQAGVDGEPFLRGQGGSRLNVLLNDTPLLGGCPGRMDPPTAYIFPDAFDKLTVLKGPQSVVHGGTTLGTVMMERDTKRFNAPSVRGFGSALYGSFDRNDEVLDAAAGDQPGYIRVIGTHSSSGDYRDGNGNAVHSKYERKSGSAMLGWTPDANTTLELSADRSEAEAAYAAKMMDGKQFDREGVNLRFTKTELSPLVAKVQATTYVNYIDHIMDTYSLRRLVLPMMGSTAVATQVDHLMAGGKALVELTPTTSTKVTLGVDYNHDEHTRRSQTRSDYVAGIGLETKDRRRDMTFDTIAAFGEVTQDLSEVNRVIGGYRLTQVQATRNNVSPNLDDDRSLNSGFARYEHDLNLGMPVTAFAGLGHVERAPDYWERDNSNSSFFAKTEKANQLDVGALFKSGNWRGSASLFYTDFQNYILVPTSTTADIKSVDAHTMGGEAEIAYRFLPSWTVEATLAYTRGVNDSENKPLAQMPPLDTSLGVKYDDGMFLGGLLLRAVAGQDRFDAGWGNVAGTDIGRTGGFAVLSANGGWRVTPDITLTGGVDNILDKNYAEHVNRTGTSSSMPGMDVVGYTDTVRVNEPGRTFWMRGAMKF